MTSSLLDVPIMACRNRRQIFFWSQHQQTNSTMTETSVEATNRTNPTMKFIKNYNSPIGRKSILYKACTHAMKISSLDTNHETSTEIGLLVTSILECALAERMYNPNLGYTSQEKKVLTLFRRTGNGLQNFSDGMISINCQTHYYITHNLLL